MFGSIGSRLQRPELIVTTVGSRNQRESTYLRQYKVLSVIEEGEDQRRGACLISFLQNEERRCNTSMSSNSQHSVVLLLLQFLPFTKLVFLQSQ
ncbi:hypothetical protein Pcinc_040355 [Petrolisthes cinctipes]|uniref:Uncharacterized protein n=1 Tax=Petrolisthes cinctipes TaxID=88211 RepID=A0AAE1BLP3_PETCI|nr:hypothetical protein Pcinc_040355 [Petrolisthes cinctipes]